MDFDLIKKNRPNLTDHTFLQKIIENKKVPIPVESIEPSLIQKIYTKTKNGLYNWVENNIVIICVICFIIALLIYRYYHYQSIKNQLLNDQSYYGYNYQSPYLNQYMPEITEEHFDTDLIEPKEPSINIISKSINNIGRKKKKTRNVQFKSNQQNQNQSNQSNQNQSNQSNQTQNNQQNQTNTNPNYNLIPNKYILNDTSMHIYNQQHDECVPKLLNLTNDRMLTTNTNANNLNIINSSSYAPYNLRDLNEFHPFHMN